MALFPLRRITRQLTQRDHFLDLTLLRVSFVLPIRSTHNNLFRARSDPTVLLAHVPAIISKTDVIMHPILYFIASTTGSISPFIRVVFHCHFSHPHFHARHCEFSF